VFGIGCEEGTKEVKEPGLRKGFLGKEVGKSLPERRRDFKELGWGRRDH
jgi:hypothetical protein